MASSYSPLKIELIGTGEQAGTWGTTTNTNLGTTLEEAITGRATATFPSDADYTLPYIDSNSSQVFRNLVLNVTSSGNLSSTRNLIIPAIEKQYLIENNTSGSQSIVIKTAAGSGITVPNGRKAHLFCDGTTTRFADDFVDINGGAIDGTPIGASSASTGVFSTATITTATVTTGNITTGNINTLLVGTQTNKATISYTTNTARTLTIPALDGNRTFAFINQYQEWTAEQSFGEDVVCAKNLIVEDNLVFSGAGTVGYNRILGNTATGTINNRLFFQDGAPNTTSLVNVMPSGSGIDAGFLAYNSSTPGNSSVAGLVVNNTTVSVASFGYGSGTLLPLIFEVGGSERMRITTGGEVYIAGTTDQGAYNLQVNGTGVWAAGPYVDGSDEKLKENIQELDEGLAIVEKLRPVSFKYRQDTGYTTDIKTYPGFIAQDLQAALEGKNYVEGVVQTGGKYLSVSHQSLIPILTKAIQELKQEIDALKAKG